MGHYQLFVASDSLQGVGLREPDRRQGSHRKHIGREREGLLFSWGGVGESEAITISLWAVPEADLRNGNSSTPQLSSTFYLLHTEINVLYLSISPHNNSTKRLLRYPHVTNEETEAQRD